MASQIPRHGHDPLIGMVLEGLYRVEKLMAQGGMGSIYHATQLRLGFPVAVKVLRSDLVTDEKIVKRFVREALAVSQLRHPHIVQLIDAGRTPQGVHFIVMEFLPGLSLDREIAKTGGMPPERALAVVSQSAAALEMAHRKGIIHRDLKPANIFLVEAEGMDVFAKVLDFGIAKFHPNNGEDMTKLTQAGSTMGTPHYMSPEQIQGHEVNRWADIYSLGVILWECLVGKPPFKGDSPMEVFMGHIEDPLPAMRKAAPHVQLPRGVEEVVRKALNKRPADRYQTMQEFKDALENLNRSMGNPSFASLTPVKPISPSSSGVRPLKPRGQNNATLLIVLAIATVIIIVLVVLLLLTTADASTLPSQP